ncbi:MAG: bacillithiol biosynthesis cysteine-adding enzyme BshC [Acidobacteriota bacterium]
MRVESLPFAEIPGQSKLFLDYLSDPLSLTRFYPNAVRSHTDLADRIATVLERQEVDRGRLCDILVEQNTKFGAGAAAFDNIDLLRKSGTVAVLTGQQAGLFTGPLYTIYKALSAVKAAACLRSRGFDAVPVFWAATEDHDFEEVSVATIAGDDGGLQDVSYVPAAYVEKQPVGEVVLDESAGGAIDELLSFLPPTEFSETARDLLKASYTDRATYGTAFARLISRIFAPYGLIVVDPLDAGLKRLASPIYKQAITDSAEIVDAIIERGVELKADGYHTQVEVAPDYFPLFWHDDEGRRVALKKGSDGKIHAAGSKAVFTIAELEQIAMQSPESFSPGVMLRPVVQDYLFPTVCYFGGGAEIAYFAQNSEAYRILDRPVTPILHRQSFTIVEARFGRNLEKLGLEFTDLFRDLDSLRSEVVARVIDPNTAMLFADVEEKINAQLHRLDETLSAFDGPLASSFANRRRKIIYHIAATRSKFERERLRSDEVIDRRLRSATTNLLPRGHLQERSLNVAQYLDRYGEYFIDWVYNSIDLDDSGHRIVYL